MNNPEYGMSESCNHTLCSDTQNCNLFCGKTLKLNYQLMISGSMT